MERSGTNRSGLLLLSVLQNGNRKVRLIKPGKLTPLVEGHPEEPTTPNAPPYRGNLQVPLPSGQYRHIASFSLAELLKLGWDGAMYINYETLSGKWAPFVCGYDSDPDNEYEPVDVRQSERAGLVGLPPNEVGIYMTLPTGQLGQLYA